MEEKSRFEESALFMKILVFFKISSHYIKQNVAKTCFDPTVGTSDRKDTIYDYV